MNETVKNMMLVAEDDQALSDLICSKLHEHGVATMSARSVAQALEYIEKIPTITAVWMDHYLFGQDDGLVLVSKLKSDNSTRKNIQVFVVSNTASESKINAYLNLGVDRYYVKANMSLDDIVTDICNTLPQNPAPATQPVPAPAAAPAPTPTPAPQPVAPVPPPPVVEAQPVAPVPPPTAAAPAPAPTPAPAPVQAPAPAPAPTAPPPAPAAPAKKKVLIIEDEQALRKAIAETFNETGRYIVVEARDGMEGYTMAIQEKPDAIVLDNEMPVLDGIGFLQKMRVAQGTIRPYVLMLTNTSNPALVAQIILFGIRDYLVKSDNSLTGVVEMIDKRLREKNQ
jgi:CheY-like chemotaxis protein